MLNIAATIQSPPAFASAPSAFATMNALLLAVFLVGIGLLLLLVMNANKRGHLKGKVPKTGKLEGRRGSGDDLISQLPYMSKEELRAMVLLQKAAPPPQPETGQPAPGVTTGVSRAPTPVTAPDRDLIKLTPQTPTSAQAGEPESLPPGPASIEEPHQVPPPEVTVLIDIAMAEAKKEEGEPKRPKHKYSDSVERSLLSNELPDEFKRKSRKI
jgi:hypothetical protein